MKATKLILHQVFGVEHLELELGKHYTVLKGPNDVGKSSVLNGIRAIFGKGDNATLLRQGADQGEAVLVIDDGTILQAKFRPGKTERTVNMAGRKFGGKVSRTQEYLREVIDEIATDPISFILAKGQRRKDLLLEAIPMTVTVERLQEVTGRPDIREVEGHALEVISVYAKDLFEERTSVNRAMKEAQTGVMRLMDTLPPEAPDGDWAAEVAIRDGELKAIEDRRNERVRILSVEMATTLAEVRQHTTEEIQRLTHETGERIAAIRQDLSDRIQQLKDHVVERQTSEHQQQEVRMQQMTEEFAEPLQQAQQGHERAKAMHEQSVRSEGARDLLRTMQAEMAHHSEASAQLTAALDGLNALKDELTRDLPIPGLEVKDGDILLNGLSIDVINEASQVMLAAQLAKLRMGPLGLVVMDDLEKLDDRTKREFFRIFDQDDTFQLIGAEVVNPTDEHPETDSFHVITG